MDMVLDAERIKPIIKLLTLGSWIAIQGCAGLGDAGAIHSLVIWNRSQFDLLEVRIHSKTSFEQAENTTRDGLLTEAHVLVPEFVSGSYVTAIRRRVDVGERIAVTTADAVYID
ncbi:hypothetical protein ACFL6C_13290, partial [Myxococcota bacterium]